MKFTTARKACIAAVFALSSHPVFAITIDGRLDDWGIVVADGTSSNLVGTSYTGLRSDLAGYMEEDTNDTSNSYKVTPYYGGQNYDGEFFGALVEGNTLYLAIMSGQRSDNGLKLFAPGDIRIGTDMGVFGIEVGGGPDGSMSLSNELGGGVAGSTYTLNGSGYTTGHTYSSKTTGSLWRDANWIQDPFGDNMDVQLGSGGTEVGAAGEFVHTVNSYTFQHSVIELSLDLSLFNGATLQDFYWSPSCSNDRLYFETDIRTVPEPAGIALLGLGLLGLGLVRRRR